MKREEAVMISEEEFVKLNNIEEVIFYLMTCYKRGINVYCPHNDVILYSCDGYTFDEYYLLAMGITPLEKKHLDGIVFCENREHEDLMRLSNLTLPIYEYLIEMHKPLREELKNGKETKKLS